MNPEPHYNLSSLTEKDPMSFFGGRWSRVFTALRSGLAAFTLPQHASDEVAPVSRRALPDFGWHWPRALPKRVGRC